MTVKEMKAVDAGATTNTVDDMRSWCTFMRKNIANFDVNQRLFLEPMLIAFEDAVAQLAAVPVEAIRYHWLNSRMDVVEIDIRS